MNNMVNVAWMYPDILNLHGERANAKALELIANKMQVKLNIDRINDLDEDIDLKKYDILLFNAGELKTIESISNKLKENIEDLTEYVESNKIILVTGTTGALFSDNVTRIDGHTFKGLNILNMDIIERNMVIGDDLYYETNNMEIIGSQIQMIDINLKDVEPFGKIKYGYGNNGNSEEGARIKNAIFTNALGPILVKNPWFTEYLIRLACENKNIEIKENKIEYDLEMKSFKSTKEFIDAK